MKINYIVGFYFIYIYRFSLNVMEKSNDEQIIF